MCGFMQLLRLQFCLFRLSRFSLITLKVSLKSWHISDVVTLLHNFWDQGENFRSLWVTDLPVLLLDWVSVFFTGRGSGLRNHLQSWHSTLYWGLNFKACVSTQSNHEIHNFKNRTSIKKHINQPLMETPMQWSGSAFWNLWIWSPSRRTLKVIFHTTTPRINKDNKSICCSSAWDSRI